MPCSQWCRLVELYQSAVNSYSEAAQNLSAQPGAAFNETWQRAERARTKAERCRTDVLNHEHDHACMDAEVGKSKKASASAQHLAH
ncbi:MAG TPA: hypothetical protein VGJ09_01275 [Bryobacteraceae bacterium]|jgi:hypothetical protein